MSTGDTVRRTRPLTEDTTMAPYDDVTVSISAPWDDWRSAQIRLNDLSDPHWHQPAGAPRPLLHAYVTCERIVSGALPHVCDPSSRPHRIRVCILKKHNTSSAYTEVERRARDRTAASSEPRPRQRDPLIATAPQTW